MRAKHLNPCSPLPCSADATGEGSHAKFRFCILYFEVYILCLVFCVLYSVFVVAGQKAEIGYVIWVFSDGYIATHYGPLLLYLLCQGFLQDCHRGLLLATR